MPLGGAFPLRRSHRLLIMLGLRVIDILPFPFATHLGLRVVDILLAFAFAHLALRVVDILLALAFAHLALRVVDIFPFAAHGLWKRKRACCMLHAIMEAF